MGFIFGVIFCFLALFLLILSIKLILKLVKYLLIIATCIYLAPGLLIGHTSYRLSRPMGISWISQLIALPASVGIAAFFWWTNDYLWAGAFTLSMCLAIGATIIRFRASRTSKSVEWGAAAKSTLRTLDAPSHMGLWLLLIAFAARFGTSGLDPDLHTWIGWGYWAGAFVAQVLATAQLHDFKRVVEHLEQQVLDHKARPLAAIAKSCKDAATQLDKQIDRLIPMHVASHVLNGRLIEIEVGGRTLIYSADWYATQLNAFTSVLAQKKRVSDEEFGALSKHFLNLDLKDGIEHLSFQTQTGQRYQLEDGYFFVSYSADYEVQTCAGCGMGRFAPAASWSQSEWFCSDICRITEQTCVEIHRQSPESFVADSVGLGMTLVSSSDSWQRNHRVLASGAQGHGTGAENANTYVDRLLGKFSKVIGSDNKKNGADRILGNKKIQTKYCVTAGKSVGGAFDQGGYRYWDGDKPMQLEVPRDQYDKAVLAMRKKIKQGALHPITDPDEAVNIVRKGHLTYEHAKNLTKFGSWESLSYDAAEGVVAGVGSAAIGFTIAAGLVYARTGDTKVAFQAAAIQAGKSGLTTAASYVSTQQLHRIELVQIALKHVNVNCLSPSVRSVLESGYGVSNSNQLNLALRGNIVSAVVSIAITSVPDVYRLVRREVTIAKLKRTVLTATGAVIGGTAGSIAGGAVGSVYGPFGTWTGKVVGSTLGAMAGGALIDTFFAEQKEREREAANALFRAHLEHLAIGFFLSEVELRCVIKNFLRVSSDDMHQKILAGKNRGRPYLNSLLKPIVIGVVKQRDSVPLGLIETRQGLQAA